MPAETDQIRITARLKLSAGAKPPVVIENLVRAGWSREEATEAVAAELARLKSPAHQQFKVIHTRKSLLDRIVDGLVPILIGLAQMAAGVGLSIGFSALTFGAARVVFIGLIATGFATLLYGLLASGDE